MKRANWSFPLRPKKIPLFPIKKVYGNDYWVKRVDKKRRGQGKRSPHSAGQVRGFVAEPLLSWAQTCSHLAGTGDTLRNLWPFSLHPEKSQSGFQPLKSNSRGGLGSLETGKLEHLPFRFCASPSSASWWVSKTWAWATIYYLKGKKKKYHMPGIHIGVWQKLLF